MGQDRFGYDKPFKYSADWYADTYHHYEQPGNKVDPGPGIRAERDLSCLKAMGVTDGDRVLVPGCGGGHNISLLKSSHKDLDIVGFDWSETVLDFCRSVFPDVSFVVASVSSFSHTQQFDRVVAFDFTEHLSLIDYIKFLNLCFGSLRPGGTVGVAPGMAIRPEHINIMHPCLIAHHLVQWGFRSVMGNLEWTTGVKP